MPKNRETSLKQNLFYMYTLSVIQPARLQDIIRYAPSILPAHALETLKEDDIRCVHQRMRENSNIYQVRRGTYCLTTVARRKLSEAGLERTLANQRLFLMKSQRKKLE